jgi:hypothetical protein
MHLFTDKRHGASEPGSTDGFGCTATSLSGSHDYD